MNSLERSLVYLIGALWVTWMYGCREKHADRAVRVIQFQPENCYEAASANNQLRDPTLAEREPRNWLVSPDAFAIDRVRIDPSRGNVAVIDLEGVREVATLAQTLELPAQHSSKWCVAAKIKRGDHRQRVSIGVVLSCLESVSCKPGWTAYAKRDASMDPGEWEWLGGVIDADESESLSAFLMVSGAAGIVSVERIVAAPSKQRQPVLK